LEFVTPTTVHAIKSPHQMKLYNALIKKNKSDKIEDIILLKEGFSFSAFIFSGLWFFYHRMWRELFALIIINIAFVSLGKILSDFDQSFLEISFLIIIALNANYWLCESLIKKNYEFAGLVFGRDLDEAKLNFITNLKESLSSNLEEIDEAILCPKAHLSKFKIFA
jgi:hypothetical protein